MRLTIKRRIAALYTLLTVVLLAILLPIVYGTVSASLNLDIQSRLESAIAQVLIAVDDQDEKFTINSQVDLPDYISLCVTDQEGRVFFSTSGGQWLKDASVDGNKKTSYQNETYTVLKEDFQIEEYVVTASAAISSDYAEQSLSTLRWLLLVLAPIYLGLSVAGAYLLAKRAIRPIADITRTAEAISAGDLSKRIAEPSARDEVQELAITFNTMLDRLQESFQRERQFTSDASHELRTPVAVISACAEELAEEPLSEDGRETLEAVQKESQRMNKIISQLLVLTRGYEGRYHLDKERLPLREAVGSVLEEMKELAAAQGISLFNQVPEGMEVWADQSLLTQLLINLVGNAVKYGKQGGWVIIRAAQEKGSCVLTVSDNGIGMSPEELEHIFERFYRADKARDRSGSGLGLSIAQWIVHLHGGEITAQSQPGKGSQFTVALPRREGAPFPSEKKERSRP